MELNKKDEKVYKEACNMLKEKSVDSEKDKKSACLLIKEIGDAIRNGDMFFKISTKEIVNTIDKILDAMKKNDLEHIRRMKEIQSMVGVGG